MKIAVVNFSGNVGKTTVATSLLRPRLPNPNTPYLAIETINDGAKGEKKIESDEYGALFEEMMLMDDIIVDVGSSNIEGTIKKMREFRGSHDEFDYFIVPTDTGDKQLIDTNSTLVELIKLGIKPAKIRLVFNKVNKMDKLDSDFADVIETAKPLKIRIPTVGIAQNEVYERLRKSDKTIEDVLAMKDLRKLAKETTDMAKKKELVGLIAIQTLAINAKENLDDVYKDLNLT